ERVWEQTNARKLVDALRLYFRFARQGYYREEAISCIAVHEGWFSRDSGVKLACDAAEVLARGVGTKPREMKSMGVLGLIRDDKGTVEGMCLMMARFAGRGLTIVNSNYYSVNLKDVSPLDIPFWTVLSGCLNT